jgi:hypothetical protein
MSQPAKNPKPHTQQGRRQAVAARRSGARRRQLQAARDYDHATEKFAKVRQGRAGGTRGAAAFACRSRGPGARGKPRGKSRSKGEDPPVGEAAADSRRDHTGPARCVGCNLHRNRRGTDYNRSGVCLSLGHRAAGRGSRAALSTSTGDHHEGLSIVIAFLVCGDCWWAATRCRGRCKDIEAAAKSSRTARRRPRNACRNRTRRYCMNWDTVKGNGSR